eukprot:758191-Hanusia_phi.AAC.1
MSLGERLFNNLSKCRDTFRFPHIHSVNGAADAPAPSLPSSFSLSSTLPPSCCTFSTSSPRSHRHP